MLLDLLQAVGPIVPEGRDYITTGGAVLIALITTVGGVLTTQGWRTRKAVNRAATSAQDAADKVTPVSNGFTGKVEATLARIERDLGGIREEMRTERSERIMLANAVSKLIEREN